MKDFFACTLIAAIGFMLAVAVLLSGCAPVGAAPQADVGTYEHTIEDAKAKQFIQAALPAGWFVVDATVYTPEEMGQIAAPIVTQHLPGMDHYIVFAATACKVGAAQGAGIYKAVMAVAGVRPDGTLHKELVVLMETQRTGCSAEKQA